MTTIVVLTNDMPCNPTINEIIENAIIALDRVNDDLTEREATFKEETFWNLRHPTAKVGWPFISRRYITVGQWADKKGIERHPSNFDTVYIELQSKTLFGFPYLFHAVDEAFSRRRHRFDNNEGIYKEVRRIANITGCPGSLHIPANVYNFIMRWSA